MQKTLASVEGFIAPVLRSPAGSPTSVIESVSACPKAPFAFCSQLVNGAVVHWLSAVHPLGGVGGFWKPPSGFLQRPQKISDLPFPAPVLNAVFDTVPVVSAKGIGSPPISAPTCGGGQSWLVGYSAWPVMPESPGVHGAPWFGPPLHVLVVELQIGQGLMAGSFRHDPPGQSAAAEHGKPALPPVVAAVHRFGKRSAVRKTSELRGSETLEVPAAQSPLPETVVLNRFPTVLMTHVLAFGTMLFGIGSGGPNRHEH